MGVIEKSQEKFKKKHQICQFKFTKFFILKSLRSVKKSLKSD